jgi:hypothetical protein
VALQQYGQWPTEANFRNSSRDVNAHRGSERRKKCKEIEQIDKLNANIILYQKYMNSWLWSTTTMVYQLGILSETYIKAYVLM